VRAPVIDSIATSLASVPYERGPDACNRSSRSPELRRSERLLFLLLAILIWPFIAVGVVAGWGFLVWMYYMFTGPPGPV